MAEPTTANYPASYEDVESLMGALGERRIGVVKTDIGVAALQCTFDTELTGLTGPCTVLFEGGEMWYVNSGDITIGSGETIVSLDDSSQRGFHNSTLQPHTSGEQAYFTVTATHVNQMKRGIIALQNNGFLLGTEAEKVTYESGAVAGEGWLASDNGKIYYCFTGGTFVWVNRSNHDELTGLTDDDHNSGASAYHIDTRATSWHTPLTGDHIAGGEDHDHYSSGEGSAVVRVEGGVDASKGTPSYAGQIYFATDTELLYISADGAAWSKISGTPSGGIAAFSAACPSGWTRYTNLDGKYLYVDNTTPSGTGGAITHNHDFAAQREHYHAMDAPTTSSQSSPGNHSHQYMVNTGSGSSSRPAKIGTTTGSITTSSSGGYSHTGTLAAIATTQTGVASPTTTTENGEAPYKEVVWCQKD